MEISEIKQHLQLSEVLRHYHLQPKNNMLKCFYHEDKKPSLQVNLEKNFYKCHSCGKTGDVIQFIEDFEKLSKHEAILKAQSLISSEIPILPKQKSEKSDNQKPITDNQFLEKIFKTFRKGIYNSNPAKEYAEKRSLKIAFGENKEGLEIGFNSGQFHHGERKNEELIRKSLEAGLLIDKGILGRTGEKAFGIFANKCLIFPLRNQ